MKKKDNFYNIKYFKDRDVLCGYIAHPVLLFAKNNNYKSILDVGAGTGKLVSYLNKKGLKAVGIDKSKIAAKYKGVRKGTATKIPFKDNSFDLLTAISVIEHLSKKDAQIFIIEAHRVLKKDGSIFIITPNWNSPLRLIQGKNWFAYKDPTHINYYTLKSLKKLLNKNGFAAVRNKFAVNSDTPFDWPFPNQIKNILMPLKYFVNYILISSPFTFLRDSIWVSAKK